MQTVIKYSFYCIHQLKSRSSFTWHSTRQFLLNDITNSNISMMVKYTHFCVSLHENVSISSTFLSSPPLLPILPSSSGRYALIVWDVENKGNLVHFPKIQLICIFRSHSDRCWLRGGGGNSNSIYFYSDRIKFSYPFVFFFALCLLFGHGPRYESEKFINYSRQFAASADATSL